VSVTGPSTLLVVVRTADMNINQQLEDGLLSIKLPAAEDPDCSAKSGCDGGPDEGKISETTFAFSASQRLASIDWAFPENECSGEVQVIAIARENPKDNPLGVKTKELDRASLTLGCPVEGLGVGTAAVPIDELPQTSVAFLSIREVKELADILENQYSMMVLVSDGWDALKPMPQEAFFESDGGPEPFMRLPVHSVQRAGTATVSFAGDPTGHTYLVSTDAYEGGLPVVAGNNRSTCHKGRCFRLTQAEDGTWNLSGTAYGSDAANLPAGLEIQVHPRDEAPPPDEGTLGLQFDPAVAAVFAQSVGFSQNPVGLELTGRVVLRGAPRPEGEASTLAQGRVRAHFAVDEDNDLTLASASRKGNQGTVVGTPFKIADILVEGHTQGGPATIVPPVIVIYEANGKGTRNVATASTASPQLL
jgi:hypothetical protein